VVSRRASRRGPSRCGDTATCSGRDSTPVVTLGEGMTPLIKADRLGEELGLRNLYLKNDSMNRRTRSKTACYRWRSAGPGRTDSQTIARALHRQPCQLGRGVCPRRAGLECFVFIRSTSSRPSSSALAFSIRTSWRCAATTTRSTGCAASSSSRLPGLLQHQYPALLRGGVEDADVRDGRAAGLEAAGRDHHPDRQRLPVVRHRQARGSWWSTGWSAKIACEVHRAQALGCSPVYNAFSRIPQNV